jgi:hypothetical protein
MELAIGDRVKRKRVNAFRYSEYNEGEIIEVLGTRYKIKWDKPASTGQKHSTIDKRFLDRIEPPTTNTK